MEIARFIFQGGLAFPRILIGQWPCNGSSFIKIIAFDDLAICGGSRCRRVFCLQSKSPDGIFVRGLFRPLCHRPNLAAEDCFWWPGDLRSLSRSRCVFCLQGKSPDGILLSGLFRPICLRPNLAPEYCISASWHCYEKEKKIAIICLLICLYLLSCFRLPLFL